MTIATRLSMGFTLSWNNGCEVTFDIDDEGGLTLHLLDQTETSIDRSYPQNADQLLEALAAFEKQNGSLPDFFGLRSKDFAGQIFYVREEFEASDGTNTVVAVAGQDFIRRTRKEVRREIKPLDPFSQAVLDTIGSENFRLIVSTRHFEGFQSLGPKHVVFHVREGKLPDVTQQLKEKVDTIHAFGVNLALVKF